MSSDSQPPDFEAFTRWIAFRFGAQSESHSPPEKLVAAARAARDEMLRATSLESGNVEELDGNVEVLEVLAAASAEANRKPPELITRRGMRVKLDYADEGNPTQTSICVLIQCPSDLIGQVQGQTAYLWNAAQRFELGQFDGDGKAIGQLPAGVKITLSDFAKGNVKLESR